MGSVPDFRLPDLGEGLVDAEIVQWLVSQGDVIEIDQPVVEVETAKATIVVPAPFAGTVTALHGGAGGRVTVGDVLLSVAAAPREAEPAPAVVSAATETGSGNVLVGYGTGASRKPRRLPRKPTAPTDDAARTPVASVRVTSPVVRRLADENAVDLRQIAGTGPGGVIRRADVLEAIQGKGPGTGQREGTGSGRRIPLRGVHKAMADVLTRSRREIPEATVWVDVDATNLLAARRQLAQHTDEPVSILALLARFTVQGLRRFPALNARVEADEIVVLDRINLGFAAQTDRGLVVPVVRDSQSLTTRRLSNELHRMTGLAREGKLPPAELGGGTFTINNYGTFGVDGSAAIINHPEVAILGFGRVIERPWIVAGQVTARHVGQLTLAFDHRACDGGTAGGFLRFVADCVENPVVALADT